MIHLITIGQIIRWTGMLWLLLCAVWIGSFPFIKHSLHNQPPAARFQQSALFIVGLYLIFGSPAYPDWFNQPVLTVTFQLALVGFGIVLCGVAFGIWARLTLGENWSGSPSIKRDHALILCGPYRIVRHPIYTGILTALLGSALQHGLVRSFLGVLICGVSLWLKLMVEEQFMVHHFGGEYLRYRRDVSALVPFLF
jgi:protein-S-isoprenylcysteine O-methyltransferase Ste14